MCRFTVPASGLAIGIVAGWLPGTAVGHAKPMLPARLRARGSLPPLIWPRSRATPSNLDPTFLAQRRRSPIRLRPLLQPLRSP
jgi:hypothetical protein